jgi:hypothetical protein
VSRLAGRSERQPIQNAGAIGIHGCLGLAERVGGLATLAQADQVAGARAEVVEGDDLLFGDFSLITTDVLLYHVIRIGLPTRFLRSQVRIP